MNPRDQLLDRLIAEGKSDDEIRAALQRYDAANPSSSGREPVSGISMAKALVQEAIPAVGPFLDEAEGASKGVGAYLADKVRGRKTTLKGRVQEGMRDADAEVRRAREAMGVPGAILGTAIGLGSGSAMLKYAGKAAPLFADVPKPPSAVSSYARDAARLLSGVVKGPTGGKINAVKRAGKSIALGAGLGAVTGYGAGQPGDRSGSAMTGGALGAVAGAVAPVVEGASAATRRVREWLRARHPDVRATQAIMHPARIDQIEGAIGAAPRFAGETVADVTANSPSKYTNAVMREAVSAPTQPGGDIQREMAERATGRAQRVDDALTQGTGLLAEQPEVTNRMVHEVTKANRDALYRAALDRNKALDNDALREILDPNDPAVKQALGVAASKMKQRRIPKARKPWLTDGDEVAMWQTADFNPRSLDYIKRSLDAQVTKALRNDQKDVAEAILTTRDRLVAEADRLIPGYAEARAADEGRRALQNAMSLGRRLGKGTMDVRDAEYLLERITPKSADYADPAIVRDMFRRGVADGLRRRMGKAKDGVQAINALVGRDNAKEVARLAFPDDAAFGAFEQELMNELRQLPGEASVQGASVDASLFRDNALGPATPWALSQALKGSPQLLASQAIGEATRGVAHKVNKETAEEIMRTMRTRVGSPDAQKILARIKQERDVMPQRLRTQAAKSRVRGRKATASAQRLLQALLARENDP